MKASRKKTQSAKCDKWKHGVCLQLAKEAGEAVYCPLARAAHAAPGECCHHPLRIVQLRLTEMTQAGIKLDRYSERLKDPEFVDRLYSAFLRKFSKRSRTVSS